MLLSAQRLPVLEVAKRAGVSRPTVWRWKRRYAEEGVEGLLRDKTRPPGIAATSQRKVHEVVALTLKAPPGGVTHWTGRAMARASSLSLRTIQRVWADHKLQPHRVRTFKRSTDPSFAANSTMSSGSISIRRAMRWWSPSTRKARSRRSTAPSPACRSSAANARPCPSLATPPPCGRRNLWLASPTTTNATACPGLDPGGPPRSLPPSIQSRARSSPDQVRGHDASHAIGIRSSSASSPRSNAPCQPKRSSTPSSTMTPRTSIPRSRRGWPTIHAGRCTSHQPRAPG